MADVTANSLELSWDAALQTVLESYILELAKLIFGLSYLEVRLSELGEGKYADVKKFLSLARAYPGLPSVVSMPRSTLEGYLSLWTYAKQIGILACEEKIVFDGDSEIWPVFRIEMIFILIQQVLLHFLSHVSIGYLGNTHPRL